jgi:hypothetical protein
VNLPLALSASAPVRAFSAARRSGMGTMRLTARIVLTTRAALRPGPYYLRPTVSRIIGP